MRLFDRHDWFLLGGLIVVLLVVLTRPLGGVIDIAREAERTYHLELIPALILLTVVLLFQQQTKRQQVRAQAVAAASEARQARERARELEQLNALGVALAQSRHMQALREALRHHLPPLLGDHTAWVSIHVNGKWEGLVGEPVETVADGVLLHQSGTAPQTEGIEGNGHICFPIRAGGVPVGVLAVMKNADVASEGLRSVLPAAATLIGIAVDNVQHVLGIRETSVHDSQTGCFTRAYGLQIIETELRRGRRSGSVLSLIVFDIDNFKAMNDQHGHQCGDAALAAVGQRLIQLLRRSDIACRYGGDEFLVLLPDTAIDGAIHAAEKVRQVLAETAIRWKIQTLHVTASFGVAASWRNEHVAKAVLARAETALSRAKLQGRNRVCAWEAATPATPRAAQPAESPATKHRM